MTKTGTFAGVPARKMKPTQRHRPAIWENMLGTVYAMDDAGAIRYFDLDHAAAIEYAGANYDRDPRIARTPARFGGRPVVRWGNGEDYTKEPRGAQLVLWILR